MSVLVRAILALDGRTDAGAVRAFLPSEAGIDVVGVSSDGSRSWGSGPPPAADLMVVACTGYSDTALALVDESLNEAPQRPVVIACTSPPNGFLRRAFEAGADDVIVLPEQPEKVAFALEKAVARKRGSVAADAARLGRLVCVLGPKGGTGKTLTATNLAVCLAHAGARTTLVDIDLQFGDVGLTLGVAPERTIYDLARAGGTLDAGKVEDYLVTHSSGVRALLAPTRPDAASAIGADLLREVWRLLRTTSDVVVVDTPGEFTPEVIAAIDASSDACMVAMLDTLSLKNARLGLETLELMGYDRGRVRIVLNRADSRVGISVADAADALGRTADVLVPSDRDIPRAINDGTPITVAKPASGAARAFQSLAAIYGGADAGARRRGPLGWRPRQKAGA